MTSQPAAPSPSAQVLIVEDEPDHADAMAEALRRPGHVCTVVGGVAAALAELRGGAFDVIVTDLRMPSSAGQEGVESDGANAGMIVLQAAAELQPEAKAVMVTAHGDPRTIREALKVRGAFDFVEKPLDLDIFRAVVNRAAEHVLLRHQAGDLKHLVQDAGFEGIVAGSGAMLAILDTVRKVAPSKIPVLVTGESGTGKDLIARAIHELSPRSGGRYVPVNCAGQSESLIEDELFGHVRGAFTGADQSREGVFEYADGGTIFLDEIGDMPLPMQAKLLRVLENGEVVRLGSNEPKRVDARLVSATNQDLDAMVKQGRFREDLYFRIQGSMVHLPPLRDRREDIPRIVQHALARFAVEEMGPGTPVPDIAPSAMMKLAAFDWPGNVRQLINVVRTVAVMAIGDTEPGEQATVELKHLPDQVRSAESVDVDTLDADSASLAGKSLQQIEKRAIRETLRLTEGNRERAAAMLGIGERTLYRKLKEYGLH